MRLACFCRLRFNIRSIVGNHGVSRREVPELALLSDNQDDAI